MTITELAKKTSYIGLTTLQHTENLKTFIGQLIELSCIIQDIDQASIKLQGSSWPGFSKKENLFYMVNFDSGKFGKELITFSSGDKVKITARVKNLSRSEYSIDCYCHLDLLTISR